MLTIDLTHEDLRLSFQRPDRSGYYFTSWVRLGQRWIPAANWPNTLVSGSLALAPKEIVRDAVGWRLQGTGHGMGVDGAMVGYEWEGTIIPAPAGGMTVEAQVSLPAPLSGPPALILWLGPLSTIKDRQALTWRRTFLGGPTRNSQGLPGNDLPALYFYDPLTQVETILVYDGRMLTWAPNRLLMLQCRELFEYDPTSRYGVGLIGASEPLHAGQHRFRWQFWQRAADAPLDQWEAVRRLTQTLGTLLDGQGERPQGATCWERFAAGTLRDLQNPEEAWIEVSTSRGPQLGLRAYVRNTPQFHESTSDQFELMTVADVLAPLLLYIKLHPEAAAKRFAEALALSLPGFHHPHLHFIGNRYPADVRDRLTDLWYFFENGLIKLSWIALIRGEATLKQIFLDGLHGAAALARRTQRHFPLFADFGGVDGPVAIGAATNYSAAGLYAFGMLLGAEISGEPSYREEARQALIALRYLPIELLSHEPQQLAFAAAAAALLSEQGDREMTELADLLVRTQLRMAYWQEDPHALQQGYRLRGLFQACASLLYPAFKEEVEAILPWVVLLRRGVGPTELMLKFMNLGRQHSFFFFDPCLPKGLARSPCPFIPYENLGTSELPATGQMGKEIYGAGEVFWLYLLFEALGRADDPAIMTIYLDLLEPVTLTGFPPPRRRFLLYNPTPDSRDFLLQIPHLPVGHYRIAPDGHHVDAVKLANGITLRLDAGMWREIELIPEAL